MAVFIPKEQESHNISQFRSIALLNIRGKLFFAVLAKRLKSYLIKNGYTDTNFQKRRGARFSRKCGTFLNDLGADPEGQAGKKQPPRGVA